MSKKLFSAILLIFLLSLSQNVFACEFTEFDESPTTCISVDNYAPTAGDQITIEMKVCNHKLEETIGASAGELTFGGGVTTTIISSPSGSVSIAPKGYYIFEWVVEVGEEGIVTIDGFSNINGELQAALGTSIVVEADSDNGGEYNGGEEEGDEDPDDYRGSTHTVPRGQKPQVSIIADPLEGTIDVDEGEKLEVEFAGEAKVPAGYNIVSWVWEFGDDTGAEGQFVTHKYEDVGDYIVNLTVTIENEDGQEEGRATADITVNQCNEVVLDKPIVRVGAVKKAVNVVQFEQFHFDQVDPNGVDCQPTGFSYLWGFMDEDGTVQKSGKVQSHEFATMGRKIIGATTYYEDQEATTIVAVVLDEKPVITSFEPEYKKVFLFGAHLSNTYNVGVEWNGNTPLRLEFTLNGSKKTVPATAEGGSTAYDMGFDFKADDQGGNNILTVVAVGMNDEGRELASKPNTLSPKVILLSVWLASYFSAGEMSVDGSGKPNAVYKTKFIWPDPKIETEVNVPSWVPYLSGKTGLEETGVDFEFEAQSKGEGKAEISGGTTACIACPTEGGSDSDGGTQFSGTIFGNGKFEIDALRLVGGEVGIKVGTEISKENKISDLFPAVKAAENIWLVGRLVRWVTDRAKLEAKFSPEIAGSFEINESKEHANCTKGLRCNAKIGVSFPLLITLILEIIESISAQAYGGATPTGEFKAPAAGGDLIEVSKLEFLIKLGFKLIVWRWSKTYEGNWTWTYPSVHWQKMVEGDWEALPREYGENYGLFVANLSDSTKTKFNTRVKPLISNVYPLSDPEIAYYAGTTVIAYAHDDLNKPNFAGEEILLLVKRQGVWENPVNISNNSKMDFAPKVAFADNNKVVIVWTQQKNEYSQDPGLSKEFINAFEIAVAVFNPETANVEQIKTLTNNDLPDLNPKIVKSGSKIFLVWDSFDLDGTSSITYSEFTAGNFSLPDTLAAGQTAVEKDVSFDDGKAYLAYISWDDETEGSEELLFRELDEGAESQHVTEDSSTDSKPKILFFQNTAVAGDGILVWIKEVENGRELFSASLVGGKAFNVKGTGILIQSTNFELVEDNSGNAVLLWSEITDNQPELFYAVYDRSSRNWNEKQFLTSSLGFEEKMSAAFTALNSLIVAVLETEIELQEVTYTYTGQDMEEDRQLESDERTFSNIPVPGKKNLSFVIHAYANDLHFNTEKGIEFSASPEAGKEITVKALFKNTGDNTLTDVNICLFDEKFSQIIETKTIEKLKAGKEQEIEFSWTPAETLQSQSVSIILDPFDGIKESDEENNKITALAFAPDVQIVSLDVERLAEDTAIIKSVIRNSGNVAARKISLAGSFSLFRNMDSERVAAETKLIYDLNAGEEREVLVSWDITGIPDAWYDYYLVAELDDQADLDEGDNEKSTLVEVLPNLTTSAILVSLEEDTLEVILQNNGIRESGPFALEVFDGETAKRILTSETVDSIPPNEEQTVSFLLSAVPGDIYFILLDPENEVEELYENDNLIVNIKEGAVVVIPPIVPPDQNITTDGKGIEIDPIFIALVICGLIILVVIAFVATISLKKLKK